MKRSDTFYVTIGMIVLGVLCMLEVLIMLHDFVMGILANIFHVKTSRSMFA